MPGLQEPAGGPRRVRDFTWGSHSLPPTHKGAAVSLYQTKALRVANSSTARCCRNSHQHPKTHLGGPTRPQHTNNLQILQGYLARDWQFAAAMAFGYRVRQSLDLFQGAGRNERDARPARFNRLPVNPMAQSCQS